METVEFHSAQETGLGLDARQCRDVVGGVDQPREASFDIASAVIPRTVRLSVCDEPFDQL
jgi:hypothetical protein